jgi:hypothetical protein
VSGDEEILRLPSAVREQVGAIWAERARSELGAGSGFAQIVVGLYELGAPSEVLALATEAAHQEVAHANTCRELAELYLGREIALPRAKKVGMPPHRGASDALRASLHVVGLCCFNETIAAQFLARCLDASHAKVVRARTSTHLRDEIGHARVGWAYLGSIGAHEKRAIAPWLPRLARANGRAWLERVRTLPTEGIEGHGYPPVAELELTVRRALREIVLPGFAEAGLDAKPAERELARL